MASPTEAVRWLVAEAAGTFALVFAGTAAVVVDGLYGGVTHVGVSLVFGLVVLALVYALGDASGAHLNPAVTTAFWLAGRFPGRRVLPYAAAQCGGALAASLTVRLLFPAHETLGATLPADSPWRSFVLEFLLTLFLMFVVLCVSTGAKEKGITAGIAVGAVIGLEALFGGPVSGASMNPARSLGPAVVSGHLEHLWVYLVAPVVGAIAAVPLCRCVHAGPCCSHPAEASP
jgi:aquaporin Z